MGSKNFQHFDPREVLETQPTPFLNQLSALEPILFYQDSPFKSVRELFSRKVHMRSFGKKIFSGDNWCILNTVFNWYNDGFAGGEI